MTRFDARTYAAALAASPPAAGAEDFLPRAAACHLMQAAGNGPFFAFRPDVVWPGFLGDFRMELVREDHIAAAAALLAHTLPKAAKAA